MNLFGYIFGLQAAKRWAFVCLEFSSGEKFTLHLCSAVNSRDFAVSGDLDFMSVVERRETKIL